VGLSCTLGGPDDQDAVVCRFIAGAKRKLLIAVQELDSRTIAQAVLAAKAAEVGVEMILEGDTTSRTLRHRTRGPPPATHEENRLIHAALLRAGIDVITDLNPAIFHQKFVVRDPEEPTAAVLTGSTNFTLTDTGTNPCHFDRHAGQQPEPPRPSGA
jgi:hypothetical protein